MSMSFIYEKIECFLRLWMGVWFHIGINTTTDTSPDLWELAKSLPYASLQTMPIRFGWGCRTFQTASHVHVIHIWEVWAPSQVVDGRMASPSHHYHHNASPDLGKLAEILPDASVQTMPLCFDWGSRTFQTASNVHVIHLWEVLAPSQVVDGHMALHSHLYHHRRFPRFVKDGWNPT